MAWAKWMRSAVESFSSSFFLHLWSFSSVTFDLPQIATTSCSFWPISVPLNSSSSLFPDQRFGHSLPLSLPHRSFFLSRSASTFFFLTPIYSLLSNSGKSLLFGTNPFRHRNGQRDRTTIQVTRKHRWEVRGQRKINNALSCGRLFGAPCVGLSQAIRSTAEPAGWCAVYELNAKENDDGSMILSEKEVRDG